MTGLTDTPTEVSRQEPPPADPKGQVEMGLTDPSPSPHAPIQENTASGTCRKRTRNDEEEKRHGI
jgi:hypothetical protein